MRGGGTGQACLISSRLMGHADAGGPRKEGNKEMPHEVSGQFDDAEEENEEEQRVKDAFRPRPAVSVASPHSSPTTAGLPDPPSRSDTNFMIDPSGFFPNGASQTVPHRETGTAGRVAIHALAARTSARPEPGTRGLPRLVDDPAAHGTAGMIPSNSAPPGMVAAASAGGASAPRCFSCSRRGGMGSILRLPPPSSSFQSRTLMPPFHPSQRNPFLPSDRWRWSVPYGGMSSLQTFAQTAAAPRNVRALSAVGNDLTRRTLATMASRLALDPSRRGSFKHVVLGPPVTAAAAAAAAAGTARSSADGAGEAKPLARCASPVSEYLATAAATNDAAHAMTELSRRHDPMVGVAPPPPPSQTSGSRQSYRQMKHPHPSIVPSLFPSEPHTLPKVTVKPDDVLKTKPLVKLSDLDIVLGRGGHVNVHRGNMWFRDVIQCYRMKYCVLIKGDKMQMARNLANWFYLSGARFLVQDDGDKCWYEVGDDRATRKCSQSLREGTCAVVRKTLEESMLSGNGAATDVAVPGERAQGENTKVGQGYHSNTITPTSQLEERDESVAADDRHRAAVVRTTSGTKGNKDEEVQDEKGSDTEEDESWAVEARGAKRDFEAACQGTSKALAKKWDNWRKRPRRK